MPLRTLEDLVFAGAHRTLEQIIGRSGFDLSMATDYLTRRYGSDLQVPIVAIGALISIVAEAVNAAALLTGGADPGEVSVPELPGLTAGYHHTVIGEIADPLRSGPSARRTTYPMAIQAEEVLSLGELQRAADQLTQGAIDSGQTRFGGAIHGQVTLPGAAAEIVRDTTGGEALPTITVLSVYKGG